MTKKLYLKDQAYEQIKHMIIHGEIDGPVISEQELVDKLGISRTPVREALMRLQNIDNFVTISPKRGIYIREITVKEANDLMDVRLATEMFSFERIGELITDEQIELLDSLIAKQKEMADKDDVHGFLEYDLAYHQAILEIYGNDYFVWILSNITDRLLHLGMRVFTREKERMKQSIEAHISINDAIKAGDFEQAKQNLENHIKTGKKTYLG
uniref:GntR family transcriptional regulator n=1 Tax=uncultured Allobacillus sp. TaxID=1638025 RepID=UPI0025998B6E|nr:GntR family transcriptional regulator [uncultured Allobacillus sp.]